MKRVPWLIVSLVLGMFVGGCLGEPEGYHHGTLEETMTEISTTAYGAFAGLVGGLLIDMVIGFNHRKKIVQTVTLSASWQWFLLKEETGTFYFMRKTRMSPFPPSPFCTPAQTSLSMPGPKDADHETRRAVLRASQSDGSYGIRVGNATGPNLSRAVLAMGR